MNYYVMTKQNKMVFRGNLADCKAWCERMQTEWKQCGMPAPEYRVFYGPDTKPCETFKGD